MIRYSFLTISMTMIIETLSVLIWIRYIYTMH